MASTRNPFRLNVGFLLNQPVGTSRDIPFEVPNLHLEPDLDLSAIEGNLRLTRTGQGLLVQSHFQGTCTVECSRCLEPGDQSLKIDFTELYAFSPNSVTDSGLLLPEDAHIDLAPLVREYMLLEVPINPLCRPDCKGLCPVCGGNLNQTTCNHDDEPVDPRLAKLSELLQDQND